MTTPPQVPEEAFDLIEDDMYRLRLFVTGVTPNSARAVTNTREFCETYLKGRYELEIIDVYQQPLIAESEQMYDTDKMLKGLSIAANQ